MTSRLIFVREIEPRVRHGKGRVRRRRMAIFRCMCGNENAYVISDVESQHTKQCMGCAINARIEAKKKHEKSKHPLYRKWQDMKKRCYNRSVDRYGRYGGRGIIVCSEWKNNFTAFYDWCLANGWMEGLQIDRINNDGNYTPSNCRISTQEEQGFNKSNTRYIEYNGERVCLAKLVKSLGIDNKGYHKIYTLVVCKGHDIHAIIEQYK